MNVLNSCMRSKLDLTHVGFARGEKESEYFCTPVLSKVIGWAGVDGIHFCTTNGFDEMIFAVSPMNTPGNYVHPVARNFEDFLRLILACYDTAVIEQCWFMDREVFERFLEANQPDAEAQKCLDEIRKKYQLSPMEDPFAYIHKLQEEFDYDAFKFPPEYYELVDETPELPAPEWKVTWEGDSFHDQSMEYPACYTQMTFRIEPDMNRNQFRIVDCTQSDQPRRRDGGNRNEGSHAVSFGIIGGADGPTTIILGQLKAEVPQTHMAMSSLRFEPEKEIEWRIVFQEKPNEDLTVSLL